MIASYSDPLRRGHYENLVGTAKKTFGGDFDGNGLVKGIEKALAPYVFGDDLDFLTARLRDRPDSRSTGLGEKVGEIMGRAYVLGTWVEEIPHE